LCRRKQTVHLNINVLNRFRFSLISLQYLEELLIDFGFVLITILENN